MASKINDADQLKIALALLSSIPENNMKEYVTKFYESYIKNVYENVDDKCITSKIQEIISLATSSGEQDVSAQIIDEKENKDGVKNTP